MTDGEIRQMIEYAHDSYYDSEALLKSEKLVRLEDESLGVRIYVHIKQDKIIFAFRGTNTPKGVKQDSEFWKRVLPLVDAPHVRRIDKKTEKFNSIEFRKKVKVHFGFDKSYNSSEVKEKIHEILKNSPVDNVYITGHSYGAALAALCALDLSLEFSNIDCEVLLFGCPRIGNRYFKEFYNFQLFKTLRVVNKGDIVSHLPPWFFGYKHIGTKILIGNTKFPRFWLVRYHNLEKYYFEMHRANHRFVI